MQHFREAAFQDYPNVPDVNKGSVFDLVEASGGATAAAEVV